MRATNTGRWRPAWWLVILTVLALTLAACGDDATDGSTTSTGGLQRRRPRRAAPSAPGTTAAGGGEAIKLGILAECEGAFGAFNEDVVAGVVLALVNGAGATSNSPTTALDGFSGANRRWTRYRTGWHRLW